MTGLGRQLQLVYAGNVALRRTVAESPSSPVLFDIFLKLSNKMVEVLRLGFMAEFLVQKP